MSIANQYKGITARTDIHSSADTVVRRERQYGFATNGQVAFVRSRFGGRPWTELQNLSYDRMGRLQVMEMINNAVGVEYDYADDGSLLSISSDPFVQTIYRADCPGLPTDKKAFLNGRTTAEQFILRNSKEGKTGETLSYRYDYSYEGNMLTHAAHTELSRSKAGSGGLSLNAEVYENPDYSEQVSYGLDGRPQHIMRHGLKDKEVKSNTLTMGQTTTYKYGIVDEITLEYEGVRLKKANDNGEDSQLSGATDFAEGISRSVEYEYDGDGRLTRDWNKTSSITYNVLGLPATVTRGTACIHYTYDSDGRLLKIEKGTNKLVSVVPDNPNGAIVSHIEFECSEVDKRCGDVEYVDGKIERIHNEAGWTDGKGQYVAAIRDAGGSLRATWTKREVPTSPGSVNVQLMHYDNLTAYYPYGLPWADRQGGSRDQYEGKELERFAGLLIYDFHARRYDPQLCLFQGPDPLAINYPSFHPFLYCAANPVSFTDPTGCIVEVVAPGALFNVVENSNNSLWKYDGIDTEDINQQYAMDALNALNDISMSGDFGYNFVKSLVESESTIRITPPNKKTPQNGWEEKNGIQYVIWDNSDIPVDDTHQLPIEGNQRDWPRTIILGHEMGHAHFALLGLRSDKWIRSAQKKNGWLGTTEIYATHVENRIRRDMGYPLRTFYEVVTNPFTDTSRGAGQIIDLETRQSLYVDRAGNIHRNIITNPADRYKY